MGLKVCAAGVAVALSAATLAFTTSETAAKPAGWGAHGFKGKPAHISKWHGAHFPRAFRRAPFGGFVASNWPGFYPGYDFAVTAAEPTVQRLDPYLPPAPGLSCQRSLESVTVPSEDGGERKIRVTRC